MPMVFLIIGTLSSLHATLYVELRGGGGCGAWCWVLDATSYMGLNASGSGVWTLGGFPLEERELSTSGHCHLGGQRGFLNGEKTNDKLWGN